ncbi:MAG: hypothetical protein M3177_03125 [Pseudomonadota bacterium]|nr:hypothetical protein [Pseudomonadota bacterium]
MTRLRASTVAVLLLAAAPAAAQRWPDEQCLDNPNLEPCLQSRADELARAYGVGRIEEHRDAGDEVLRIFYVKDGNVALLAFVRRLGSEPTAKVYFPPRGGRPTPMMQAPIPQEAWSEAFYRAAHADRTFVAVPRANPAVETICLHPWSYIFEASVPADHYGRAARIRRHSITSCDDQPLLHFAADFQRLALPLFPSCDLLDPVYGNAIRRLVLCQRLSGDRLAAARIMNLAHPFQVFGGTADPGRIEGLFAADAVIDWNGRRRPPDQRSAAAFWRARIAEDGVDGLHVEAVEGQSRDRVRLVGQLFRDQPGSNDGTISRARIEQVWRTTWSGGRVESVTVGPWRVQGSP